MIKLCLPNTTEGSHGLQAVDNSPICGEYSLPDFQKENGKSLISRASANIREFRENPGVTSVLTLRWSSMQEKRSGPGRSEPLARHEDRRALAGAKTRSILKDARVRGAS